MVRRTREKDVAKKPNRMPQVTIENPIINSPYDEPTRHFGRPTALDAATHRT
jgi:hypothetical protein